MFDGVLLAKETDVALNVGGSDVVLPNVKPEASKGIRKAQTKTKTWFEVWRERKLFYLFFSVLLR